MMTNYKEILRLDALGISKQDIAAGCLCSRNTVTNTIRQAREKSVSWESVRDLSNEETASLLYPHSSDGPEYVMPDYAHVCRELQKDGVTLNLLWMEYCEQCRVSGGLAYKSTQFNKYYRDFVQKNKATMHLEHRPGETMQVDWAGQTACITNTDTGGLIKEYLFTAVLPYSGYTYAEAFHDMGQENWIAAHVNAYKYFGGVTKILTPDNLKTGVTRNTKDELVLNRIYQEMAEHYNTAVIPARPRSPKDKAAVEGTVGVVSTFILAALRNVQFLSLHELNSAIWEKLDEFNHKPFQKKEGSRASVFEEEKPFLLPLPRKPFELAAWKTATVQCNYHVAIDKQYYSVPYEYIRKKVEIRVTKRHIEVFFAGTRISSHVRLYGRPNQYSTLEEHMPPDHLQYIKWNGERFISWGEKTGASTAAVIRSFLARYGIEQQGYKPCLALIKLADKYSPSRIEAACEKAFSFSASPSIKGITAILRARLYDEHNTEAVAEEHQTASLYGFTRGAEYYNESGE